MTAAQLDRDLDEALRAGQTDRLGVLRLVKTSVKNQAIKLGRDLNDDEVMAVFKHEAKQRRDSIEAYTKADRKDLAADESAELAIIQSYLPEAMSQAELDALVDQVVTEQGATDQSQTGAVIGAVMAKAAGRADGAEVARLVRGRLGQA